uniref:Uncharacterized protein n=1 Tax=Arundo donax TaxID=35708 RepID=A0A0A8YRV1_ARUDO
MAKGSAKCQRLAQNLKLWNPRDPPSFLFCKRYS